MTMFSLNRYLEEKKVVNFEHIQNYGSLKRFGSFNSINHYRCIMQNL
jgi:hypothetical protein